MPLMNRVVASISSRKRRTAPVEDGGAAPEGDPAWLDGQPNLTWIEIANTDVVTAMNAAYSPPTGVQGAAGTIAYAGATVRNALSELWRPALGGHLATADNSCWKISLQDDVPAWSLEQAPSSSFSFGSSHNADGRPASRHDFGCLMWDDVEDKAFLHGARAVYGNGGDNYTTVDAFDRNTTDYVAAGYYPAITSAGATTVPGYAKDLNTGDVYIANEVADTLHKWDRLTKLTAQVSTLGGSDIEYNTMMVHDPIRNRLIFFHSSPFYLDLGSSYARTTFSWSGAGSAGAAYPTYAHYDELRDSLLIMGRDSNTVYEANLTTFAVTTLSIAGTPPLTPSSQGDEFNYLYGRWFRMPELGISGVMRGPGENLFVFRTGTPPTYESDWTVRSAGAIFTERFNTSGSIDPETQAGDVVWEQTIKRSGNGAWRVNIPASRGTDVGSQNVFFPSTRGNGTTTYYQLTYYCPESFSRYKPSHGAEEGGVKMFFLSGAGDASNTIEEIILHNKAHSGFMQGYHQDGLVTAVGWEVALSTPGNSSNFRLQQIDNGVPTTISTDDDAETRYGQLYTNSARATVPSNGDVFAQGFPSTRALKSGALRIPSDGWMTVLVKVTIGTLGTASSTIEVWGCTPGFPYRKIYNKTSVRLGNGGGHAKLVLTPYDTGRVGSSATVIDTYMICAEFIMSASWIPAPKVR